MRTGHGITEDPANRVGPVGDGGEVGCVLPGRGVAVGGGGGRYHG